MQGELRLASNNRTKQRCQDDTPWIRFVMQQNRWGREHTCGYAILYASILAYGRGWGWRPRSLLARIVRDFRARRGNNSAPTCHRNAVSAWFPSAASMQNRAVTSRGQQAHGGASRPLTSQGIKSTSNLRNLLFEI